MKPLLPKSEEKKTHIQKKAKSAKYKGIERISRRVFYLVVLLIFSLFIAVLTLAILKQDEEIIEESSITMFETTLILLFGISSVFSRYKSRLLAYIMMSLSYTVSLLAKFVLEDLCRVVTKHCSYSPVEIRFLHLGVVCCFIAETVLAYLIRDAQIMADNYTAATKYHYLETLHDIQLELIREGMMNNEALLSVDRNSVCNQCFEGKINHSHYICFEDNLCVQCKTLVVIDREVEIRDDWFDGNFLPYKDSIVN